MKSLDGFFTTFLVTPYSKYIARFCARRGWTPNQMTTVSMVIGTLAAVAFALGTRPTMVAGAVLLQAAFTIDCVDGQLARYTRTFSKLGAWLDSVFDRGKEYVVFAGLAIGATPRLRPGRVGARRGGARAADRPPHARLLVRRSASARWSRRRRRCRSSTRRTRRSRPALPLGPGGRGGRTGRAGGRSRRAPGARADAQAALVRLARRGVRLLGLLDRTRWGRWGKRIIVLPIGERFALISITAALFSPARDLHRAAGLGRLRHALQRSAPGSLRSVAR